MVRSAVRLCVFARACTCAWWQSLITNALAHCARMCMHLFLKSCDFGVHVCTYDYHMDRTINPLAPACVWICTIIELPAKIDGGAIAIKTMVAVLLQLTRSALCPTRMNTRVSSLETGSCICLMCMCACACLCVCLCECAWKLVC